MEDVLYTPDDSATDDELAAWAEESVLADVEGHELWLGTEGADYLFEEMNV